MLSSRKCYGLVAGQEPGAVMSLDPGAVDCSGPWLVWAEAPGEGLAASLDRQGQLAPVLVARDGERWSLVAGFARVQALATMGRKVAALEVRADPAQRCLLYLADNQGRAGQAVTAAMQCRALAFLRPSMEDAELAGEAAPLLGLDARSKRWRRLLAWLDLDAPGDEQGEDPAFWLKCLLEERVDLACCEQLARFTDQERRVLRPFFQGLRWSRSAAQEFLRDLFETCRGQGRDLAELVQEPLLAAPLASDLSPKDAVQRLLDAGRALRRPGLTRLGERFAAAAKGLGAGARWRVEPSQSFEADSVRLSLSAASREELEQALRELEAMAASPEWEALWSLAVEDYPEGGGEAS